MSTRLVTQKPRIHITKSIKRYFRYAQHMAEMSPFTRARVGCVVVCGGRVIATGFNSYKTHPVQYWYNKYRDFDDDLADTPAHLHAEIAALTQIEKKNVDWGKVDVFVYRLRKDYTPGLASPCPSCRQYMKDLGVRRVWYTLDDAYSFEVIARALS